MKKLIGFAWILIVAFGLVGCAGSGVGGGGGGGHAAPWSVSGTITDSVTAAMSRNYYIVIDSDTDKTNGNVAQQIVLGSANASYSMNINTAGNYYVYAWKDVDASGTFNSGDSFTANTAIQITNLDVVVGSFALDTIKP